MRSSNQRQFFAVEIDQFRKYLRGINFDVYLKLSEDNYAHVFSKTTGLDYQRLAQYKRKGTKHLYVMEQHRDRYEAYVSQTFDKVLGDPEIPQIRKVAVLLNMTEQNLAEIFSQFEVTQDTAENTKEVIQQYVKRLSTDPYSLSMILKLASHGDYLYYHAIATSIFSIFIAKATGHFNAEMLEKVGLGGFLHDIGCTKISDEIISSPHELTHEQWSAMKQHAKIGVQMLEDTPTIPDEVRYMIYQHHEQPDGGGYPNGLRGNAIYYPAKIISLADAFSAMVSKRPFRQAFSLEETISIMRRGTGRFDQDLVEILAATFLQELDFKRAA